MHVMNPWSWSFWIPVFASIVCGTIVGLERQVRGKPAGVRTAILICLSTQLFVRLSVLVDPTSTDPVRVIGQIVTGVGFLGAGVMMGQGQAVTGVTTASVIWVLAAIGAAIGIGEYYAAVAFAMTTVVILVAIEALEARLLELRRGEHWRAGMPERPEKRISD